jgi:hypothetical protein
MKIKVQMCYCGNDVFVFRALVCGGLLVRADKWDRKAAAEMLDVLEVHGYDRQKIRFVHV